MRAILTVPQCLTGGAEGATEGALSPTRLSMTCDAGRVISVTLASGTVIGAGTVINAAVTLPTNNGCRIGEFRSNQPRYTFVLMLLTT